MAYQDVVDQFHIDGSIIVRPEGRAYHTDPYCPMVTDSAMKGEYKQVTFNNELRNQHGQVYIACTCAAAEYRDAVEWAEKSGL